MAPRFIIGLAAALSAALAGAQVLYKTVGPDGKVSYTDRPPTEGQVQKTLRIDELPNTALPAKTLAELEQLQKKSAASGAPSASAAGVVLFSAAWCGYCRQARSHLSQKKVPFQEVDVDTPDGKLAFVRAGGAGGIPLLVAKGQKLRGFSAQAYDALLAQPAP